MAMFFKPKPKLLPVPKGASETFEVRYPRGRKPFDRWEAARDFATEQRGLPGGWAEVSRSITEVVMPR